MSVGTSDRILQKCSVQYCLGIAHACLLVEARLPQHIGKPSFDWLEKMTVRRYEPVSALSNPFESLQGALCLVYRCIIHQREILSGRSELAEDRPQESAVPHTD